MAVSYQDVDACFEEVEAGYEKTERLSEDELAKLEERDEQCWELFEDQMESIPELVEANDSPVQVYIPDRAIPETFQKEIQEKVLTQEVSISGPGVNAITFKGVGIEFSGASWVFLAAFIIGAAAWVLRAYFLGKKTS